MQVDKLSETLSKITLTQGEFNVSVVLSSGKDGIILVDTGWIATAEALKEKISELSDGLIELIIFTHQHGDHIGGRHVLGENATLISHKTTQDDLAGKFYGLDPLPGRELPVILTENELTIHFNGEEIHIIPAPGHSQGDMLVHFTDSGVLCMGDLLFSDTFPVVLSGHGGNADQYLQTIAKIIAEFPEDTRFVAGHGRDYNLDELKDYYHMAVSTIDLIKGGMAEGKTPEEMLEVDLLKDWEKWSIAQINAETWITQVYDSLSGEGKKSIADPLTHMIVKSGFEAAIEQYHELKKNQPEAYNFGENDLNMLGYQLLWRNIKDAAVAIHKLNIQEHPESANPYDSLGETYEANGDTDLAIDSYEKALELNPEMPSAIEALGRLKSSNGN